MRAAFPSLIFWSSRAMKVEISCSVGRGSSSGGISPAFMRSFTSAQRWLSTPALKSRERVSILRSPFSFLDPWQLTQCLFKKLSKDLSTADKDSGSKIIKILNLNILKSLFFGLNRFK